MAPPGRRRARPSSLSILISAFLLCSPVALAQSAVLGIDLGTEYIKAALVKPGIPLEIVLTKDSKRKETSAVAFKASGAVDLENKQYPERLYGGDALALAPRIPGDVYPNLKHILGGTSSPYGEAAVEAYKQRHPGLDLVRGGAQDALGFHSNIPGLKEDMFLVEELLAMVLKGIRQNAQTMAGKGSKIRDSVITIPAFYTAAERRAIESAADLAGLKVIGLISDGLAVGINYATPRTFADPAKGGKAEHHLVFDMGAGSTTATVLRFQAKTVKDVGRFNKTIQEVSVLGTGWDRSLGGDALNDLIVNDMVEQFVQSKGARSLELEAGTIKRHGRTMAKLARDAERSRHVLSANAETSAFFEGLYEDIDFRYKISRPTFESLAASFIDRVGAPISTALDKAGLSLADIDSVILHGGAVRTPFVQNSLEALVGDSAKLKTNVNADEAAVFGAAFKAAGLSKSFRVKDIKDREAATYSATVQWTSNGKERKQVIFQPTSISGTAKQMPFKMFEDFEFSIVQSIPGINSDDKLSQPIVTVQVRNLTATIQELVDKYSCVRSNISTTVTFHLDPASGLPAVVKGTAGCESEVAEKSSEGIMDNVKGLFGFGKKDQKPLDSDDDDDIESELLPEATDSSSPSAATTSSASATSSGASTTASKPAGPKFHSINLEIVSTQAGAQKPAPAALKSIKARLTAFDASDRARAKRSETFNTLESLTYRARDLLTDSAFKAVSSEAQRKKLEMLLGTTGSWLSAEGADATYDSIKEKLAGLQGLVDPIKNRITESSKRSASLKSLQEALNNTQTIAEMVRGNIDRAAEAASSSAAEAAAAATESLKDGAKSVTSIVGDVANSVTSSLASAASDASDTLSSVVGSVTGTPSSDNLDDFPDSSTTSSSSKTTKAPTPFSLPSSFTEEDYTSLTGLYASISSWLSETSIAQDALAAYDDPALTVADLERKAKQLGEATEGMMRKMLRRNPYTYSSSSKTKSSKSSKTASGFKIPTPKISLMRKGASGTAASPAASGTAPPEPVEEPQVKVDVDGVAQDGAPEPETADKVLEEGVDAPAAESTTDPEAADALTRRADEL